MKNINHMSYAYTQTQDNFPYPTHNIYIYINVRKIIAVEDATCIK